MFSPHVQDLSMLFSASTWTRPAICQLRLVFRRCLPLSQLPHLRGNLLQCEIKVRGLQTPGREGQGAEAEAEATQVEEAGGSQEVGAVRIARRVGMAGVRTEKRSGVRSGGL